jgi:hypothetical protein
MQIKRNTTAIAVGLLLTATCFAAQPALAQQQGPKGSVTSKEIKDGTIKLKDLSQKVRDQLAPSQTPPPAGIPDGSITTNKLADNAVTSTKVADDSLTAADLAANSVTSAELANNSVDTGAVADGSLLAADISAARGIATLDFPNLNAGSCGVLPVQTNNVLDGDLILVTAPPTVAGIISFEGRQQAPGSTSIALLACNHASVPLNPASAPFSWAVLEN